MSLRNGMWHGLRNDTTTRNLIYGKWRKEKIQQESMRASLPRLFWCQFEGAIDIAGPFITAIKARLKLKQVIHEYLINHP